ncbi:glycoside hydrolase family 88 protein [bacterium]|nr:glycoside hydrolase family 88 protein [bacterium]
MKTPLLGLPEDATPYPPRWPDEPVVSADLEALVQRPFVKSLMERVMAFQEKEYRGVLNIDWQAGTYYTGVLAAHLATGEPVFREAALAWGNAANWRTGPRPFYADDLCMGQTMLDLFLLDRDPAYIEGLIGVVEAYFGKKSLTPSDVHSHIPTNGDQQMRGRNLWWWSDALYMAPPVLVRMHAATGDSRYLDLLHELYWDTVDFLFDEKSCLFYRDANFFPKDPAASLERDKNFWSRGNGWVFAGLVRVLDYLPETDPQRARYLELFQKLTRKLVTLQKPDGLWASRLNRPDLEQSPEVSGSCFFAYGLLAGVRRGWLDRKCYLPLALRAWRGLTSKLGTDGRLGFAQLVDSAPGSVRPESSIDYTHGAFLLVASELYLLDLSAADFRALEPVREPRLMMPDASWSWFNDERAVIADEHIYLGAVDGGGRAKFYAYRLNPSNAPSILRDSVDLSSWSERDDQNNPALLRFEDKLLAVYSKHHTDTFWNWRVATVPQELPGWGALEINWSGEQTFSTGQASTSSASLARLSAEDGRIYHFFRAGGFDPHLSWSADGAATWQPSLRLIDSGGDSTRPRVKYADNGRDRIDLVFCDGHPSEMAENNLYHVYYRAGAFHASDGTVLRSLADLAERPLTSSEATRLSGRIIGRRWIRDLKYDGNGQPVAVFVSLSDAGDLAYWIARWNESDAQWVTRRIASAGSHLDHDDAGGIALDPGDDRVVYVSTDVDPATGAANATGRYQLFRGTTDATGDAFTWEQLTFDANRDNIRPFVPRGHGAGPCVLWLRGIYRSHHDFRMDVYGLLNLKDLCEAAQPAPSADPVDSGSQTLPAKPQLPSALREAV